MKNFLYGFSYILCWHLHAMSPVIQGVTSSSHILIPIGIFSVNMPQKTMRVLHIPCKEKLYSSIDLSPIPHTGMLKIEAFFGTELHLWGIDRYNNRRHKTIRSTMNVGEINRALKYVYEGCHIRYKEGLLTSKDYHRIFSAFLDNSKL